MDMALRPPSLEGRKDVFALFVEDDSVSPAHEPGSLIVVEKRPPRIGEYCVFEVLPDSPRGERRALIKKLVAITPTVFRVAQLNPPENLEFPRAMVVNIHRVIPLKELLLHR